MTTLRRSRLGRLSALLLTILLTMMTLAPTSAFAVVEFTSDSGLGEGDPGDGNGNSGGGSGVLDGADLSASPITGSEPDLVIHSQREVGIPIPVFIDGYFCFISLNPQDLFKTLDWGQR